MEYLVAGSLFSSIVGAFLGSFVEKGLAGFFCGLFLGPIGWIIVFLLPRESENSNSSAQSSVQSKKVEPPQERDLTNDTYKIWLGNTYEIKRNELFEKYECDGKLFDTLDDVLVYADSLEGEKREAEDQRREELIKKGIEARERFARGEDADGSDDGDYTSEFIFVFLGVCVLAYLIFAFSDL